MHGAPEMRGGANEPMADVTLADLIGTVSPSRIETALQCMARFHWQYVEKTPRPFRADQQLGNAVDATATWLYERKRKTRRNPKILDVLEFFASQWDYERQAIDDWQGDTPVGLQRMGLGMVKAWFEQVACNVQPEATQQHITRNVVDVDSKVEFLLTGVIDAIGRTTVPRAVIDVKQSVRAYREDRVLRSSQPPTYTLLAGVDVFEFHVLVRNVEPRVQVLRTVVTDADRQSFIRRTAMLRRQIAHAWKSGDWLPNRTGFLCSRRYCAHWDACERRFGGTVPN